MLTAAHDSGGSRFAAFGITNDPTNRLAAGGSASNAALGLLHHSFSPWPWRRWW